MPPSTICPIRLENLDNYEDDDHFKLVFDVVGTPSSELLNKIPELDVSMSATCFEHKTSNGLV